MPLIFISDGFQQSFVASNYHRAAQGNWDYLSSKLDATITYCASYPYTILARVILITSVNLAFCPTIGHCN